MISRQDVQRLIHRPNGIKPVLSVFLDMSVNSENKRTHRVFLGQQLAQFQELESDRPSHHREPLGAAFERVQRWLEQHFDEANQGVVLYAEVGGDWLEGVQLPVPVRNRVVIAPQPVIGPLAQIVESYRHHGIALVDRAHLRLLSVYLGEPLHEHEVKTSPYPTPHDVQRGGYSAIDFQKRKAEETRHFFKEFALEVAEFSRRYRPDDWILLGTDENVKNFLEFLSPAVREQVVYSAHAPIDATAAEVLERITPFLFEQMEREQSSVIDLVHDRVLHRHLAIAGFPDTLEQLQEGKVDRLVLARDIERAGVQCLRCGFYLIRRDTVCPYCGGDLRAGVDLVEAMIRLAEEQEVPIQFVPPEAMTDLHGVGALLKF
ncbi:MAG: hypothetical protein HY561_08570 [Gemmatimonadetes bacterium]|nr:hypothetical protein [Gemmatimonadota bacterium]